MNPPFPFYSSLPNKAELDIYHTHPHCKVALGIEASARVMGMGEGKRECPFCYLLGEFKSGRRVGESPTEPQARSSTGARAFSTADSSGAGTY
ncbi:hypothetical protein [Hymenobacter ruricola]|uniref:Zinc finger CHCC-type domain-containing protein n=1 Tax=Hymenobacter ruricola TaxID=2791023 RepID=A0ABS0IA68_9BACT|nr:hypothetical protein [Hymenobacter ruricola]MBF9223853.1 hypothetical protein [Hymenobacter ruricola]